MATIKKESFGKLSDGRAVELYTLRNTKGTEVKVTTYGARLVAWSAFGKDHQRTAHPMRRMTRAWAASSAAMPTALPAAR